MIDAEGEDLTQHGDRAVAVLGWPEDPGAGQLHGAVAHTGDREALGHRERIVGNCVHFHGDPCLRCRTPMRARPSLSAKTWDSGVALQKEGC